MRQRPRVAGPSRIALGAVGAVGALLSCGGGSSTLQLTIDSDGAVAPVDHFVVTATLGGQPSQPARLSSRSPSLPPAQTFELVFPSDKMGAASVEVDAFSTAMVPLSKAVGQTTLTPGEVSKLTVKLTAATLDLASPMSWPTDPHPSALAVGELTGDGKLDLVTASQTKNTISVLAGDGRGRFAAPASQDSMVISPTAMVVADVSADGRSDVVVVGSGINRASVFLGDVGGLKQFSLFGPIGPGASSIAVGAFTAASASDLLIASASANYASLFVGVGMGGYTPVKQYGTPATLGPQAILAAELNLDGVEDFVVADSAAASITTFLYTGTTRSKPSYLDSDYPVGARPVALASGDLNLDGKPDLAVACQSPSALYVLLGDGTGGFSAARAFAVAASPASVAIADLNGDHKPDLVSASLSGAVTILHGVGDGSFAERRDYATPGSTPAAALIVADLDGDGALDVAVAEPEASAVAVFAGHHP